MKISEKLLKLKTSSSLFYLLFIPPVYAIWLLGIGNVISKNKTEKLLLSCALIVLLILITMAFFIYPVLFINKSPFLDSIYSDLMIFIGLGYWNIVSILITFLSLRYEKRILKIRLKTDMIDYYVRFFVIINWWIGIWSYQRVVNKYVKTNSD